MAKKPTPAPVSKETAVSDVVIAGEFQAATQLGLVQAQHDSAVRAVALQMGYQLPADAIDPDLIQRDISANMRRSVEACLEVGKGLCVLKTACAHGEFMNRLDVLGIEARVAQKFMQSAQKFGKAALTAHLTKAIGNQTKLFEMLVLDDEQIEELELTGQTGELALDDVATMSVKELRAAVREARAEKEATDKVLADKNASMDKLRGQLKRIQLATHDSKLKDIHAELAELVSESLGMVQGKLRQGFQTVADHLLENGGDTTHAQQILAGYVGQLQQELNMLRSEFHLPDTVGDGTPEWERWNQAQEAGRGTSAH